MISRITPATVGLFDGVNARVYVAQIEFGWKEQMLIFVVVIFD